jgi:hypothetical protein
MKWKKKAAGLFASLQGGQGARRRKYEKNIYLSFSFLSLSLSIANNARLVSNASQKRGESVKLTRARSNRRSRNFFPVIFFKESKINSTLFFDLNPCEFFLLAISVSSFSFPGLFTFARRLLALSRLFSRRFYSRARSRLPPLLSSRATPLLSSFFLSPLFLPLPLLPLVVTADRRPARLAAPPPRPRRTSSLLRRAAAAG